MMKNSRQRNYLLNSGAIVFSKAIQLLLSFILRTFLIKYLGDEVLGLDGLFSSVLSVLSLADMGINTAVIYSLYVPLAEKDYQKVAAYVSFYKKFYIIVGICIFAIGLLLTPFLQVFVNLPNEYPNIRLYYVLAVANTAVSYFLSSRRVIFEADQRNRVVTFADAIAGISLQILQIILIWMLNSYLVVLCLRIVVSAISNIVIYIFGDKDYPFLKTYRNEALAKGEKKKLYKGTGAVMCHKVGSVIVTGTDSLIISTFVSTIITGYYSNYFTIISGISFFVTSAMGALTPSIGNLRAENDDIEHHYEVFNQVVLLNYIFSAICSICLYCLLNPFILLWLGEKFIFDRSIVLVLCLNFYLSTFRFGVGAFGTAAGLFKETLIKPLLEGIINLIVSILMVKHYGIIGVFIGTTVSLVLGSVWVDPYVLFKRWFRRSAKPYFAMYGFMLILLFAVGWLISYLVDYLPSEGIFNFALTVVVTFMSALIILITVARLFPGYGMLKNRIISIVKRK